MLKKDDYRPAGSFRKDLMTEFPTAETLARTFAERAGRQVATEPLVEMMRELNRPIPETNRAIAMFVPQMDYFMFRICESDPKTASTPKPFKIHRDIWRQQGELWTRRMKEEMEIFRPGDIKTLGRLVKLCYDAVLRPYSITQEDHLKSCGRVKTCAHYHAIKETFADELPQSKYFDSLFGSCEQFLDTVVGESRFQNPVRAVVKEGACRGDRSCTFIIQSQ
jgi:hypothetical protein